MDLDQFLRDMQAAYVMEFKAAYSHQVELRGDISSEVPLDASLLYGDVFVADFLDRKSEPNTAIEFVPDAEVFRGPATFVDGDLSVEFDSVSWDNMTLSFPPGLIQAANLNSWFNRWLDVDRDPGDLSVTSGIIHSVSVTRGGISVDFGTAPSEAAVELLELLRAHGAGDVHVTRSRN